MREPIQHPISKLGFFTENTSSWLIEVREAAASLEETREKPHVLTDSDVAGIRRVYAEQAGDLVLFEDTAARWAAQSNLTAQQRTGLETLDSNRPTRRPYPRRLRPCPAKRDFSERWSSVLNKATKR